MRTALLIGCLFGICAAHCAELDVARASQAEPPTTGFNFHLFQLIFNKHYPSWIETLARQKIFLANALQAFVSAISYNRGLASSWRSINQMSDWTRAELNKLRNRARHARAPPKKEPPEQEVAAIDPEVLEGELGQFMEENAIEWQSAESDSAGLVDLRTDLLKTDVDVDVPARERIIEIVASNNPTYVPAEVDAPRDIDEPVAGMLMQKAKEIVQSYGYDLAASLFSELVQKGREVKSYLGFHSEVFVDHRDIECFGPIKNQGNCGSCYIFAAISLLEYKYCLETDKLVAFSEQYVLDCGVKVEMDACEGGWTHEVVRFSDWFGIHLNQTHPYSAKNATCPHETPAPELGYIRFQSKPELLTVPEEELEEYLEASPMMVDIATNKDFSFYGGGVDQNKNCDQQDGHAMVLIGHGIENGREYLLFRNSYGPHWGVNGHYKMDKRAIEPCLLDALMIKASFSEQTGDV